MIYEIQREKAEKYGHVCGCPYASVGSEIATLDEKVRAKSEHLMDASKKYLESAIADAIREGSVTVKDPAAASQAMNSLLLGMLLEARVKNDLTVLENLESAIMNSLGVKAVAA
jgi:TetR/AcrR family transcriptional repressor of nem operon